MTRYEFECIKAAIWWNNDEEKCKQLSRAVQKLYEDSQWQPIEMAPKDGSNIILWSDQWKRTAVGRYGYETWWVDHFQSKPTHWKPLPDPPKVGP